MKIKIESNGNLTFKNKLYTIYIELDNLDGVSYIIEFESGRKWKHEYGLIDESLESICDYLDVQYLFSKNRRYGRQAKKWFNQVLKPYYIKYKYDPDILYNSRVIKNKFSYSDKIGQEKSYALLKKICKNMGFDNLFGENLN